MRLQINISFRKHTHKVEIMKVKTQPGKNHYKAIYGVFPINSKQTKNNQVQFGCPGQGFMVGSF